MAETLSTLARRRVSDLTVHFTPFKALWHDHGCGFIGFLKHKGLGRYLAARCGIRKKPVLLTPNLRARPRQHVRVQTVKPDSFLRRQRIDLNG